MSTARNDFDAEEQRQGLLKLSDDEASVSVATIPHTNDKNIKQKKDWIFSFYKVE